jgi:hypothetical protein
MAAREAAEILIMKGNGHDLQILPLPTGFKTQPIQTY